MFGRISSLVNDLIHDPVGFLLMLAAILLSLILHEVAHGYVAMKCGDRTAYMFGRITLNPAKHLDPIGTLCMLFLGVGWAKAVPVNPRNFRHYRRDMILVSLAGIATNFILFIVSLTANLLLLKYRPYSDSVFVQYLRMFLSYLTSMNIGLAIFNLIPVPPLDGYRVLDQLVLKGRFALDRNAENTIRIVFLVVCMSGVLDSLLSTVINSVYSFFSGILISILF